MRQLGDCSAIQAYWVGCRCVDAKGDILWRNHTSGDLSVRFMDGSSIASQSDLGVAPPLADWTVVQWAANGHVKPDDRKTVGKKARGGARAIPISLNGRWDDCPRGRDHTQVL